jgi:4-carboxymuconolactone decarboxylase
VARIPLVDRDHLDAAQRRVYDDIIAGPRGQVAGPLLAVLHSPDLADRWQRVGEFLRYRTSLGARLNELSIIATARRWNSEVEWYFHAQAARKAGLAEEIIRAIRDGEAPSFTSADERAVYDFTREVLMLTRVSEPVYQEALARLGTVGIVELTGVIGYYTMVSMTLNAHEIPLPGGKDPELPALGKPGELTPLPPAK